MLARGIASSGRRPRPSQGTGCRARSDQGDRPASQGPQRDPTERTPCRSGPAP